MNNFEKIKQSNIDDFAEWFCFSVQSGTMPTSYPFKLPNFIREDEKYKLGLKIIKQWLQQESEG
jgi:hypothetical protein